MIRRLQIAVAISGMMLAAAVMLVCAWASIEYSSGHDPLSFMRGSSVRTVGESSLYGPARDSDGSNEVPPEKETYFTRTTTTLSEALPATDDLAV